MLIDVHTHAFPDAIAGRTIEFLKSKMLAQSNIKVESSTDGTVDGLRESMHQSGVDISLVMPIVTKPSQSKTVNDFAESLRKKEIISFGSVHPADPNACEILSSLSKRGFMGIKLHPEFQDFYIDSKESLRVIKHAQSLGLFVLIHAGGDLGYPPPYHCTPDRLADVLDEIDGEKLIAAHLGGFMMWEDVLKHIAGKNVYIDTAAVGTCIQSDVYREIIRAHGADHVLFGSDSPWEDQAHALRALENTGITDDELDKIKYKNAKRLFNL